MTLNQWLSGWGRLIRVSAFKRVYKIPIIQLKATNNFKIFNIFIFDSRWGLSICINEVLLRGLLQGWMENKPDLGFDSKTSIGQLKDVKQRLRNWISYYAVVEVSRAYRYLINLPWLVIIKHWLKRLHLHGVRKTLPRFNTTKLFSSCFLLVSLAIIKYRQYFLMLQTLSLNKKNWKTKINKTW